MKTSKLEYALRIITIFVFGLLVGWLVTDIPAKMVVIGWCISGTAIMSAYLRATKEFIMCNLNCSNCACKTLYAEEYNKLLLDDVPAGSAAMIAQREMVETELDLGLEDFLETLDEREFTRE